MSENLINIHLIGKIRLRPVRELTDAELQRFINAYVEKDSSGSLLSKLTTHLRAILNVAVDRRLIDRNPARNLKAKSGNGAAICRTLRKNAARFTPRYPAVITSPSASLCNSGFDLRNCARFAE